MRAAREDSMSLKELPILDRSSRLNHESRTRISVIDEVGEGEGLPPKPRRKISSNQSVGGGSTASGSRSGSTTRRERNPGRVPTTIPPIAVQTISSSIDGIGNKVYVGGGMVNAGYNGSVPSVPNVPSLTTIHEQYCSCSRWSKLEKTLFIIVSVLAFLVIVLIVTVGLLADQHDDDKPWWVFSYLKIV